MNGFEMFSVKGKVFLITGCSSGIGVALTLGLLNLGAKVFGIYNNTFPEELTKITHEFSDRFYAYKLDLASLKEDDAIKMIRYASEKFDTVDILINNAGVNIRSHVLKYKEEDWDHVFNVNLKSAFFLSKSFSSIFHERTQKGKIINITSLMGFYGGGYTNCSYASSKHGLTGLTKSMANDLGLYGVNVNAIAPGFIKTRMTEDFIENTQLSDGFKKRIPLGRWGDPSDILGCVIFLSSSASDYITGETITVDGGYKNF